MKIIFEEKKLFDGAVIRKEYFLIKNKKKILSATTEKKVEKAYFCNLFYLEEEKLHIGNGYANKLLKECINDLKKEGVKEISLLACSNKNSEIDNRLNQKQLIKFYRKKGFKRKPLKELISLYSSSISKKEIILEIVKSNITPMILKF